MELIAHRHFTLLISDVPPACLLFPISQSQWGERRVSAASEGWAGNFWAQDPAAGATEPADCARERKYAFKITLNIHTITHRRSRGLQTKWNKTKHKTKKVISEAHPSNLDLEPLWVLLSSVSFHNGICRGHYCLTLDCKVWLSSFNLIPGIGKIYGRQLISAWLFV